MYTYTHMICMYTHNLYMIYILYMICCRDNLLASTWTRPTWQVRFADPL